MPVNVGITNSIRIGIADTSDANYDSNVLIRADSVQTDLIAVQDDVTMQQDATRTVDVLDNDIDTTGGSMVVTHINGNAVAVGDSVTLATGQVVTLNPDMTFTVTTDADLETVSFTYGIVTEDELGQRPRGRYGLRDRHHHPLLRRGHDDRHARGAAPGGGLAARRPGADPRRGRAAAALGRGADGGRRRSARPHRDRRGDLRGPRRPHRLAPAPGDDPRPRGRADVRRGGGSGEGQGPRERRHRAGALRRRT